MSFEDKLKEEMNLYCRFRCDKKHTSLMYGYKMCEKCPLEGFIREIRDITKEEFE